MSFDNDNIWAADSETFAHDNMWVFKHVITRECIKIHNDPVALHSFIDDYAPILTGYNLRDYDQHILKAGMLGYTPEQIKEVNDVIFEGQRYNDPLRVYSHFQGESWVEIPPMIDLIHDIVNKPSLKMLEGFMGMSIEESTVPFDIERPLTKEEIVEVFKYCEHDVDATIELFWGRQAYINAKARACEIAGGDPLVELKHPMPRVVADLLEATKQEYPNEDYVFPKDILLENLPDTAFHFANNLDRDGGLYTSKQKEDTARLVLFNFLDCPSVMGVGGLHSCIGTITPKYKMSGEFKGNMVHSTPYHERSTDERVILIQDASAFYPTTINNCGYMSRSVPHYNKDMYPGFCRLKDEAKAAGNKEDEVGSKLFINAASGCFRSLTNKLSDPMMGISLCVTGQLYILDILTRISKLCPSMKLIQINTDGWVLSIDRSEYDIEMECVSEWAKECNHRIGTDIVEAIWQRDVNNYIMLFEGDEHPKVKGGTVGGYYGKEKNWAERGFAYSNTIIDKAIVDYCVYGTKIEDTIANETDISRFQIITRAGSSFPRVWSGCKEVYEVIPEGSRRKIPRVLETTRGKEVQRVNRIFAAKGDLGMLMKETSSGNLTRFPDTPTSAFVDNAGTDMTLDMLDREWYNALAKEKLKAFMGEDNMTDEAVAKTATTKKKTEKKEAAMTFGEKYFVAQGLVREAIAKIEPNKYAANISYEYVDTQVYKDMLMSCLQEAGLVCTFSISDTQFLGELSKTTGGAPMWGIQCFGSLDIKDKDDTNSFITATGVGFHVGNNGTIASSAQTNAIRNAITNAFLIPTSQDDIADATKDTSSKKSKTYLTTEQKESVKVTVKANTEDSVKYMQKPAAIDLYERIVELLGDDDNSNVTEEDTERFEKALTKYYDNDGNPLEEDGHLVLTKKFYTKAASRLDALGV